MRDNVQFWSEQYDAMNSLYAANEKQRQDDLADATHKAPEFVSRA